MAEGWVRTRRRSLGGEPRPTSDGGGGAPMQQVAREQAQRSLTGTGRADHVSSRR